MESHEKRWNDLFTIEENFINKSTLTKKNRNKSWKYGYNAEHDIVIISKDGTIGEIYNINSLRIALPKAPYQMNKGQNKWVPEDVPAPLKKIKSIAQFESMPSSFIDRYTDYINEEFSRRETGYWFMNNGAKTYITGHHYMYLTHTKIDVGKPDFREANRVFFIYWEACVADNRCFGINYVKIRRSGFSFMGASICVDTATVSRDSQIGILSKTGGDAKSLFTSKVVPISNNYPFFFKPVQAGMDKPKTEILYSTPATKITKKSIQEIDTEEEDIDSLETKLDWRNTDDNAYDGEKLLRLLHDESGKLLKPYSIIKSWDVTKTCLRVGSKIIGKCLMGSTVNALPKGGANFKVIYEQSDPSKRNKNGQTKSGLYALFIPMEWNYEGFIDEYGFPVFETPSKPIKGVDGEWITTGVIDYWENEVDSKKDRPDDLNEFYRQFPRTISHAFRDESSSSVFSLTHVYDQIDFNDGAMVKDRVLTRGSFHWKDGVKDSEVIWSPDKRGRFLISWFPGDKLKNNVKKKDGKYYPLNAELGSFGVDSYDISGTVDGRGSNGAIHGHLKPNVLDFVPSNYFFLEYIDRPDSAEIFYEDLIMACFYYGMPALIENNKPRILYHLKNRGYRAFSLDRPDKPKSALSKTEKELGGIPNTQEDVIQLHADCIDVYIKQNVGYDRTGEYRSPDECGNMPFNRTLEDWAKFDIRDRTKHDASISSGFALMANRRHVLQPKREVQKISIKFARYNQSGIQSKMID